MKPCPNPECDNVELPEVMEYGGGQYNVLCAACGMIGPWGDTEQEAERLWDLLPRLRGGKHEAQM